MERYYELTIGSKKKEALLDLLALMSSHTALDKLLERDEGIQEKYTPDNIPTSGHKKHKPVAPVYPINKY